MTQKLTAIHVRGFSCDFVIKITKNDFISIETAQKIVEEQIINTAVVIKVIQYWPTGELTIYNEKFKRFEPFKSESNAKKYLKSTDNG